MKIPRSTPRATISGCRSRSSLLWFPHRSTGISIYARLPLRCRVGYGRSCGAVVCFSTRLRDNTGRSQAYRFVLILQVTPFPAPGSVAAAKGALRKTKQRMKPVVYTIYCSTFYLDFSFAEAATGIFKPVPPFYSLSAIPSNALFFGCILGYQRLCSKSLELVRRQEDVFNDIFGFAMIWPYHHYCLNYSHQRLISHNRVVGGMMVTSVLYANFLA